MRDIATILDPYFELTAQLSQRTVGKIEGGYRIDFEYGSAPIKSEDAAPAVHIAAAASAEQLAGPSRAYLELLNGAFITSGSDWAFVSDDAFIDFDSTITLKLTSNEAPCAIAARLAGRADLRDVRSSGGNAFLSTQSPDAIIRKWQFGFEKGTTLPLALFVTFDIPISGLNARQTAVYRSCLPLGRRVLLGMGQASFSGGRDGGIEQITLSVGKVSRS